MTRVHLDKTGREKLAAMMDVGTIVENEAGRNMGDVSLTDLTILVRTMREFLARPTIAGIGT